MKAKFILYIQAWVRHGLGLGLGLLVLAQCQLSGSLFSVKNVCSDRAPHDMFACGEGTSTSPFVIVSDEQLNNTPDFLGSHFEVARDLDMGGTLRQPIGTDTTPFTGSFKGLRPNGQPAVISNVMINMPGSDNIGFFGAATNSATIENVGLENVMIVGRTNVGGLVGRNDGAGRISNSYATGTVEGDSEVGGLVGRNSATIFNSYATGRVTGTNQVGGLVGESNADTISNSYAAGAVTGMGNSVGGLVGNNDDSTIFNSYATGRVTGTNQVGGLVGESNADTISNSYATGAVTGMGNSVGGLVGDNESTISNSYATGNVTGTGSAIGGFVGLNNSTIDEINYFVDSDGVNGVGSGSCNGTCERRNESAILGYTNSVMNVDTINVSGLDSWDPDNWDFRSSISPQQHPAVKYAPFDADDDSIIDTAEGCGSLCGQLLPKQGEDDDNDSIPNNIDRCPTGTPGPSNTTNTMADDGDFDMDGCKNTEDTDDDNDGVVDISDTCPRGVTGWTSGPSTDSDGNGCRDSDEDLDAMSVAAAKAALTPAAAITYTAGDTMSSVTRDVSLTTTDPSGNGVTIAWSSGNTAVISNSGSVTRPSTNTMVTLTATLNKGTSEDTKTFILTVIISDAGAVDAAKAALTPTAAITYTAGDTMSSVTRDVTLTTTDPTGNGVAVSWTSGNTAVISNNGTITRPSTNTMVTLTATLSKGSASGTRDFMLTVIISDAAAVAAARAALTIGYGGSDSMLSVTQNVTLSTTDPTGNGVAVSWTSGNTAVISNSGIVTRPSTNTMVTLTATLSKGSASGTRNFMLTVIISDAAAVAAAGAALTIGYGGSDTASSVTQNVTLSTTDPTGNGVAVSWTSGNTAVISNSGIVTHPSTDTMVTLTATLSKGSASGTRNFMLTVIISDAAAVAAARAALTIGYGGSDTASSVTQNVTLSTTDPTGNGVAVSWTSGNTAVISNSGIVTHPSTDTMVTLTATLSKGSASGTRNFMLTVIISDAAAVAAARAALTIGYGGSDTASSVTRDVTLTTTDPTGNGVAVSWTSGNTAVISNSGIVTHPSTDTMVTLTATLSKGSASGTRNFMLTVIISDAAAVAAAEAALTIGYGGSDSMLSVTQNVTLSTTDPTGNGVAVSWTSGNTAVISNNGTVTRPSTNTMVTLTATLSKGSASGTRNFMLTVILSDAAAVAAAEAALTIGYGGSDSMLSVTQNVTLSTTDPTGNGVAVSWTSGNTAVISNNGTVTRPSTDTMVTLTAALSKGSASGTRNFMLTVIISDAVAVAAARAALTIGYGGSDTASSVTRDVTLSTTDPTGNGVAVSWTSGNTAVISNNGTVTRPSTDTMVTLTAALSKGSASGTRNFMLTVIMAPPDADSDGTPDSTDVDEDGDGLIEIRNLNMLDNVRNTLDGTAYNDGGGDNTTGCGGQTGITSCSGYELSRDLDFGSAASYASGSINSAWRPTGGNPGTATNPGWTPIGSSVSNSFTGTFDGNGHSISNLYVRVAPASGFAYAGLFGYTGSGAVIRNTGVVAAAVFASSSAGAYAGGLVGWNDIGSISNSYATGSVSASALANVAYAGGLVGLNFGSISNSYATGSVSASSSSVYAGGLVGWNNIGSISNSYATGSVSASASSSIAVAGGLVGQNGGTGGAGSISNSYATGSVSASASNRARAGGLVGLNGGGSISNSYATGSVSASALANVVAYAGGLVGLNFGSISNSYATGSVSASSFSFRAYAGGLVGSNGSSGRISNSYATGSVSAFSSSSSSVFAGGLVGGNTGSISNSYATGSVSVFASAYAYAGGLVGDNIGGSISNSYATGSVSSSANAGGLVGENYTGSISNSYWDRDTVVLIENGVDRTRVGGVYQDSGDDGDHAGVTALSSSQMRATSGTYPNRLGADFNLGNSREYPRLEYGEIAAYCSDNSYTAQAACEAGGRSWLAAGTECEVIAANTAANEGDPNLPDCGDLLPGQAVRIASGFLRFSNTAIGEPSTDFVFFYDIEDTATSIAISGTGVNGTTAGSYAIEDASGTAPTVSGTTISGLDSLSAGDEFYLSATFTKDLNGDGDTSDSGESFTQRYRFRLSDMDSDSDGTPDSTDVDDDGDGLIEIRNLNMLDNVRNTLDGTAYNDGDSDNTTGCGGQTGITSCSGYELVRDLDFSSGSSYALGSINSAWRPTGGNPGTATNPGWVPIGDNSTDSDATRFTAIFDGNGHSISNLYVRVSSSGNANAGLFGYTGNGAAIRNTGVVAAAVFASSFSFSADATAGGLVGFSSGSISNSYATGSVSAFSSGHTYAGGLVGRNNGSISNSYAISSVSAFPIPAGRSAYAGGLVGWNDMSGSISNSYATGSVSASSSSNTHVGGLVGRTSRSSIISNSYATGSVSAFSSSSSSVFAGGLVGFSFIDIISNSYWDRGTVVLIEDGAIVSTENQDAGNTGNHAGVTALSSSQMRATSGTHPNLGADFNLGTSSEYPLLEYGGTVGTDCKNSGDADLPVCGTLLPGQAVRMASGFLRFSNTAIGRPSSTDFVFFYDIGSGNTIDISGTGINGTTSGSYAIEDAAGTALTVPTVSGTTISGLASLSAGDEFYLSATFTKDLNGDGDTSDSGESFTQRYRFKK